MWRWKWKWKVEVELAVGDQGGCLPVHSAASEPGEILQAENLLGGGRKGD